MNRHAPHTSHAMAAAPHGTGVDPLVALADVVHDFPVRGRHHRALDGVTLTVGPGEVVGLIGGNGAGKTTLIRVLLGLLTPTAGDVALFGAAPSRRTRAALGYMAQGLGLYADLTVAENLAFMAGAFGVAPPVLSGDLAAVADQVVAEISLGLRRRVAFTAALSHRPRLLVLDEPTSGVGPLGRADLWDTIHGAADQGVGVLVTTHHMDEAEQCDRLVVLASGREVAGGTAAEIVADRMVVQVATSRPRVAMALLEAADCMAIPAGAMIRVVGADTARVAEVVTGADGVPAQLEMVPATLEEAFIALVAADRARD